MVSKPSLKSYVVIGAKSEVSRCRHWKPWKAGPEGSLCNNGVAGAEWSAPPLPSSTCLLICSARCCRRRHRCRPHCAPVDTGSTVSERRLGPDLDALLPTLPPLLPKTPAANLGLSSFHALYCLRQHSNGGGTSARAVEAG